MPSSVDEQQDWKDFDKIRGSLVVAGNPSLKFKVAAG
jgi:hypothetical protein